MKEVFKNKKIVLLIIIAIIVIIGIISIILISNNQDDGIREIDEKDLKAEFTIFQNELDNYLTNLDISKYNPQLICADENNVICDIVKIENLTKFDIIPSLEKSQYKDFVNIANGKLEVKSLTEKEVNILSTFFELAEYDYSYCTNQYREANELNKTNIVESIPIVEPMVKIRN